MAQHRTEALSPTHKRMLQALQTDGTTEAGWPVLIGITAFMTAGAAWGSAVWLDLPALRPVAVQLLVAATLLTLGAIAWSYQRRRQLWRPLAAIIEQAQVQVSEGQLHAVEVLPNGRPHYVLDDEAMTMLPLSSSIEAHRFSPRAEIEAMQALLNRPVALYWVPRGLDRLLLEVRYPQLDAGSRTRREATPDDQQRAQNSTVRSLGWMGGVLMLVVLLMSLLHPGSLGTVLLVLSPAAAVLALLAWLTGALRRKRPAQMRVLRGVVTELFTTVRRTGRQRLRGYWLRVDGELLAMEASPPAGWKPGDPLCVEHLVPLADPEGPGELTRVGRVERESAS